MLKVPEIPAALTTLERLKIDSEWGIVNSPNLLQLIQMNKNLKTLELFLPTDQITIALSERINLQFLQNLTLALFKMNPKNQKQIKDLQMSLLNFKHVEKLDLRLDAFFVDCLRSVLKTLQQFSNLKKLCFIAINSGEIEDQKFSKFKDLFKKLPDLQSLELDFEAELVNSRELTSLVDGLAFLQNLEAFNFKASLVKISPTALTKFVSLLESSRKIREIKVQVKGLNSDEKEKLQKISERGYEFWEDI